MAPEPKFIADAMLGKLAKWLRIAGYDTLYFRAGSQRELIEKAREEGRVILTRDTRLISRKDLPANLFIQSDLPAEQLREVCRSFNLTTTDSALSLCSSCNVPLRRISKEHVERQVPEYIYREHAKFSWCPDCGRVYWPGSHYKTMTERLEGLGGEEG